MRLWHEELIPLLPRQQLLGQHRECCAMRGNGWGKKHRVVDYVFKHSLHDLELYHAKVMQEMFNCTIVKQVDTNSANLLSSRSRRYLAVIGSLSFIGRQVA